MFHLMLVLFPMGLGVAAIAILMIPLWLGPLVQAVLSALSEKGLIRLIPALLGIVGIIAFLSSEIFTLKPIVIYWLIYYSLIAATHAIACWLRQKVLAWFAQRRSTDGEEKR